ncbi:MAG: ABC transporter ATP-binding protein [Oscillospiraceae bacterium]|nr:ABC transporter ATP-binding protein [Oscillospiraceae bacterium]
MNQAVLQIRGLNKHFGNRHVLKNVSFETYAGEVFGFLGPNGAGKTTTIKIAVGHLFYDEGEVLINGFDLNKNFERALESVGGIVENPELYGHMTGMQNLRQYARIRGVGQERIDEVVRLVGMENRVKEKLKRYSLGMRQRIGLAMALLNRPKLLILDEPTNGLDPAGIRELRDILKKLAHEEKVGVMVSSHLMSEMELMCDRVGIISNGVLIDVKTVEDLIASVRSPFMTYRIKTDNAQAAMETLHDINLTPGNKTVVGTDIIELKIEAERAEEFIKAITQRIVMGGYVLFSVTPVEEMSLEDAFIELTKKAGHYIEGGQII